MLYWLHLLGARVKGLALAPEGEQAHYHTIAGDRFCDSQIGNIRNRQLVVDVVQDFAPDFVFHLAAQPLVRRSYDDPCETV